MDLIGMTAIHSLLVTVGYALSGAAARRWPRPWTQDLHTVWVVAFCTCPFVAVGAIVGALA